MSLHVRVASLLALLAVACGGGAPLAPTSTPRTDGAASSPSPTPAPQPTLFRLYGSVVDRMGSGIPGARVDLSGPEAGASVIVQNPARYEFRDLIAGPYVVRASRDGYRTTEVRQQITADTQLDIRLEEIGLAPHTNVVSTQR
jgi:hypothetical protein